MTETLSHNLKNLRAKKQLSQQKFADSIGKPLKTYAAWEEGRAEPRAKDLIDLAREHKISIDELLTKEIGVK